MIFSIDQLKEQVTPVAKKYKLCAVYFFDSYARDETTDISDVDIHIDRTGSKVKGMLNMRDCMKTYELELEKRLIFPLRRHWNRKVF